MSNRNLPRDSKEKVIDFSELEGLRERYPDAKIVQCHGVFDVVHAGHLAYLESARRQGDLLVVTVTSDEFVNKGPGRPYFNSAIRSRMLAGLELVDFVTVNTSPDAVPAIEALKPHFYVKGPDYRNKEKDATGAIYLEEQAVHKGGGKLVFTADEMFSASKLINEFFPTWNDEQLSAIKKVKLAGGLEKIEEVLDQVSKLKVMVVGEPIIDRYVFCLPESISSKGPCVSAKYLFHEDYAGGSLAIGNQLSDFVKELTLIATNGGEKEYQDLVRSKMDSRIRMLSQEISNVPTPKKTRYITEDQVQRIFEITNLRSDQWFNHSPLEFSQLVSRTAQEVDVSIVADFGHGLFEGDVLKTVGEIEGFVGLNVQTNSSNYGYNPYTKHKNFNFVSIDTREVRVAYHDRYSAPVELARRLRKDVSKYNASCALTVGPHGAYFFPAGKRTEIQVPAFADRVVDATGAGDAFFALCSLLVRVECPEIIIPFLGNLFAGLKTKTIGNKVAVSKAQLIKAATAVLK